MGSMFTSKQSTKSESQSKGTQDTKTENNLWDNPQLQQFLSGYNQQYSNAGGFNVPINAFQTGAAGQQSSVAANLNPAFATANTIGSQGIAPQAIQSFQNPYENQVIANLQDDFLTQNQQTLDANRGRRAAQGALGNQTGADALIMQGQQDAQAKQLASTRQQGFNTAAGLAGQSAGLQLQGAGTAGQLTGAATGANMGLYNMGQGIWDSNYKNAMTPYSLYNQGVQGYQGLGNLAGNTSNTATTGSTNSMSTTRSTPSPWSQGMSIAGTLFGLADGGVVPSYSWGGMTPFDQSGEDAYDDPMMYPMGSGGGGPGISGGGNAMPAGMISRFQQQKQPGGLVGRAITAMKPLFSSTSPGTAANGGWSTTTTPSLFGFAEGGSVGMQPYDPNSFAAKVADAHAMMQGLRKNGGAVAKGFDGGGAVSDDASGEDPQPAMTPFQPMFVGAPRPSAPPPAPRRGQGLIASLLESAGIAPPQDYSSPVNGPPSTFDDRFKRWSNLFLSQGVNPQAAQAQLGVEAERRARYHQNKEDEFRAAQLLGQYQGQPTQAARQYKLDHDLRREQLERQLEMDEARIEKMGTHPVVLQVEAMGYPRGTPEHQAMVRKLVEKADKAETKFDEVIAKGSGKDLEDRVAASKASTEKLLRLEQMEKLVNDPRVTQGKWADWWLEGKKIAQGAGFNVEGVREGEALRSIGNQFALQLRNTAGGEGMPGALSDQDRNFLLASIPGLTNTQAGNQMMIKMMREIEQYKLRANTEAQRYIYANKSNVGLTEHMDRWTKEHPVISEATKREAEATIKSTPSAAGFSRPLTSTGDDLPVLTPEQARAKPPGTRFRGTDGKVYKVPDAAAPAATLDTGAP